MSHFTKLHLLCWCLLFAFSVNGQTTHYVDCSAPAAGDGTSWATAYNDLQIPLGIAVAGDIVVVAQGYYTPSSSDPGIYFELVNGVNMLGGFVNTDINLTQRDPANNVTVLSGNLGADCSGSGGSGQSYTVLYSRKVSAATVLDGFTITGGNAGSPCNGSLLERHGGGWYNDGSGSNSVSSPTIRRCIFTGNSSNCGGGAIFNDGNFFGKANPSFEKCTFEGNDGGFAGGAIYNNGNAGTASPQFFQCKFISNGVNLTPVAYGGACYNFGKNGNSNPVYLSCLFQENGGYAGGALYNLGEVGNANPIIINCTFYGNSAVANGGTIYSNAGSSPNIGNADPYIANSLFFANTAAPFLGPIFRNNNGDITVKNCLFDVAADCTELNSGVGPDVICLGINLYNDDPLFSNEAGGDFSLTINSPAVNAGDNGEIGGSSEDVDCDTRIQQGIVDLGALESPYLPSAAPVELVNFRVSPQEGEVDIEWTTLSENNNDLFRIERSSDGLQFELIEERRGAGTSSLVHVYDAVDRNPVPGFNYYQLVQVDRDGSSSKSSIRVVYISELVVEVFPNPVTSKLHLSVSNMGKGNVQYEISNFTGQILYTGQMEVDKYKSTISLDEVAELPAGLYFIRVFDSGQKQQVVKFKKTE